MFTGLVETIGTLRAVRRSGTVFRVSIEAPQIAAELTIGQSVAVSGACLTVVSLGGDSFDVEMMPETASKTKFAFLKNGSSVNLERALRVGDRLDGHLVLGHVEGTAVLHDLSGRETKTASFRVGEELARYIVSKGSVAIDGVSLTVIDANRDGFSVGLIPLTLTSTALGELSRGDTVNVETDIIGKYVERLLQKRPADEITLEELVKLGY